mmetsp:Transcript_5759/g.16308  ORF Transcript_5759/g.16308 Transcript_5759/m.16308 type:complete len:246 (+) Transcript_5759:3003-3740(+)
MTDMTPPQLGRPVSQHGRLVRPRKRRGRRRVRPTVHRDRLHLHHIHRCGRQGGRGRHDGDGRRLGRGGEGCISLHEANGDGVAHAGVGVVSAADRSPADVEPAADVHTEVVGAHLAPRDPTTLGAIDAVDCEGAVRVGASPRDSAVIVESQLVGGRERLGPAVGAALLDICADPLPRGRGRLGECWLDAAPSAVGQPLLLHEPVFLHASPNTVPETDTDAAEDDEPHYRADDDAEDHPAIPALAL